MTSLMLTTINVKRRVHYLRTVVQKHLAIGQGVQILGHSLLNKNL